jgi:KipI family sensor histidine kinase inhibitor
MVTRGVGNHALLVLVEDAGAASLIRGRVLDVAAEAGLPVPRDVVPGARSVLLDGLPGPAAVQAWRSRLEDEQPADLEAATVPRRPEILLETTYDGADLAVVAGAWSCSPEAVVERHQGVAYVVAFCGFAPGFAYCVSTEPLPEVPRREAPRERVPRGSVALAGEYCGVYPSAMPGGWQLIGRTNAVLFDAERVEPALLAPGDRVRFRAAS